GNLHSKSQSENSNFNPQSPYGISKLFGHYVTINYRKSYNIYAVSGILFNHESPLRGEEFVTKKIIKGLIDVKQNKKKVIELGNIYTKRDWGFAKEYVEQMWKMLNQKTWL
ncbi:GDP-mannose 4,6-dehydratase, partial [Winogradskyella sp.]|uniref:GDP-mannose 4,6-dehydratase n=1 Tax=Winogradskyella sp. TaxID=1883156 RepID=UPI003510FCA8